MTKIKTRKFVVEFSDTATFTCVEAPGNNGTYLWTCTGTINDVGITLHIVNAAPTRVFQVLNALWEAEV